MSIPNDLNNPGDLRPTDPSQPSTRGFRSFDTPGKGTEALLNDLQSKISGKSSTGLGPNSSLVDFANVYAPESDNNNSGQYAANLANQLKVSPATKLGELQPRIGEFAQAVGQNEGYQWADKPADPSQPEPQSKSTWDEFTSLFSPSSMIKTIEDNPSAVGAAGLAGGATLIPSLLTALGIGGAATVADTAATAAKTNPGLLSKVLGFGKTAVTDAAIGLGIDKGANLLGIGNSPQQPQDQQQPQQSTQQDILSQLQPQMNSSKNLYNAYEQNLSPTMAGRAMLQDPIGRETVLNASISGRTPDTSSGTMDFTQAEKERAAEAKAAAKMESVVVGEGNMKTSEAAKIAMQYLPSHATPKEREAAIKHIKSEAASYGNNISLAQGINARHQQYASTRGKYGEAPKPSAHIMAHKALAKGFREAVKNHTPHKELYEKLLKHQQHLKNEQKLYKILQNKKPQTTTSFQKSLHKFGTRLMATYVGDKIGGVLGAVLGNVILDIGQKAADKRFGKNAFESPRVRAGLKVLKEELPKQYDIFKAEMEKKGIKFPKEEGEKGLIKDMKKGGVTKSEKVFTGALKDTVSSLKSKQEKKNGPFAYHSPTVQSTQKSKSAPYVWHNPNTIKSKAIKKAMSGRGQKPRKQGQQR